ncbi:hypothetical protein SNARM312S_06476 [Streptomyces narbonensis]
MPSFPAEATTTIFFWIALAIETAMGESASRVLVVSCEMLMTCAPLATAQSIALAIVSDVPLFFSSFCRIGMIVASGARPTKPVPSPGRAAMMPATLVPWPTSSTVPSVLPRFSSPKPGLFLSGLRKSLPALASTAFSSWGLTLSTPVSMTATLTPFPLVCCQSSSRRTRWSGQGVPSICFFMGKVHSPLPSSAQASGRGDFGPGAVVAAAGAASRPVRVAAVSRAAAVRYVVVTGATP